METLLSVVVPAYDEAAGIRKGVLDNLVASLQKHVGNWEIVVVDDGSTDDTAELVSQLALGDNRVKLLRRSHCGKGYAVLAGMQEALGELILFTDFDQATPIREINHLLPWFEKGYDVVVGTRGVHRKRAPLTRKGLSRGYIMLRTLLLGGNPIVDTQCGFKAFTRQSLHKIIKHMQLYHPDNGCPVKGSRVTPGFDVELLLVAENLGYTIRSVPVAWSYRHCRGMNLWSACGQGLADLVRIRLALNRGKYSFDD